MSAGEFVKSRYESSIGIHLIEVDEQTLEAEIGGVNEPPAGGINSPFAAQRSRGARAYGLRPRFVTVKWDGAAPAGYRGTAKNNITILQQSVFDGIGIGDAGTYLGSDVEVTNKVEESFNPGFAVIAPEEVEDPTP